MDADLEPDDRLLDPTDVSALLSIPTATLANWRSNSVGPPYLRVGRHVRYRQCDLDEWIESRVRRPEAVSGHR